MGLGRPLLIHLSPRASSSSGLGRPHLLCLPVPFMTVNLQSRGQLIYFLQKPKQLKVNPGPVPSNPATKNSRIPAYTFAPARLGWHVGTASGLVSWPPNPQRGRRRGGRRRLSCWGPRAVGVKSPPPEVEPRLRDGSVGSLQQATRPASRLNACTP